MFEKEIILKEQLGRRASSSVAWPGLPFALQPAREWLGISGITC